MVRVNAVNRCEGDNVKSYRPRHKQTTGAWLDSFVGMLIALFAERGRVGA